MHPQSQIIFFVVLSLLIAPAFSLAVYNSANLQSTTNITLTIDDSSTKTFNVSGTNAESIIVNQGAGTFTLNLAFGGWSEIKIISSDRLTFSITPTSIMRRFTCELSSSSLSIQRGSAQEAVTITITPSSTICTSDNTNIPSGGGGDRYVPPTPAPVPATTTPPVVPPVPATTTPPVVPPVPATTTPPVALPVTTCQPGQQVVSALFSQDLELGAKNDDVQRLQEFLATDPSIYPQGLVTGYFGPLTQGAVKAFQAKHGLPTPGRVGPMTRAKLSEVFGAVPAAAPSCLPTTPATPAAVTVSPVFNSSLGQGVSNEAVKRLQILFNSDPDIRVAASGVGSAGNETEYFGALTAGAVGKFQLKYGVVSSAGDPGYGYVGPKTRAKLLEVFGK